MRTIVEGRKITLTKISSCQAVSSMEQLFGDSGIGDFNSSFSFIWAIKSK
jgi:hypothetical protein